MALYYDAAAILNGDTERGSLKSRIYSDTANIKSKPSQVYALITECAKYDVFLKEVIDNAGLLTQEPKLSPLLSILLVHDHFFSKGGIAASSNHVLRQCVERHKARLQAEFTKARLRLKCGNVALLKQRLELEKREKSGVTEKPRWFRLNYLRLFGDSVDSSASPAEVCGGVFENYAVVTSLSDLHHSRSNGGSFYRDPNVPGLFAVASGVDLTATEAYTSGKIILQDKASCFPAHLLLGACESTQAGNEGYVGDIIDACAAPGNKTTHVASELLTTLGRSEASKHKIFACERDPSRSKILQSMVSKAGATNVEVLAKTDFLSLNPLDSKYRNVTHILLDPSCSGSGIVGREDVPNLSLPKAFERGNSVPPPARLENVKRNKRKRDATDATTSVSKPIVPPPPPPNPTDEETPQQATTHARLQKLSNIQTRIINHALSFPSATHVSYSTCSTHTTENESVVSRALRSQISRRRGWKLLPREGQVLGLRRWKYRGVQVKATQIEGQSQSENEGEHEGEGKSARLSDEEREACIRCYPGGEDGTMGFFVCCFVREAAAAVAAAVDANGKDEHAEKGDGAAAVSGSRRHGVSVSVSVSEEEWDGFSDGSR